MRRTINFLINLGEDAQQKKFSVGFLLDLSGSMQGPPLEQTKIAINNLLKPSEASGDILRLADQVNIVTFHTTVQRVCPWVNKADFDFFREFLFGVPDMADVIMRETGATALFDGMAEILTSCYNEAKNENERVILIFSDGCNYGDKQFTQQDVIDLVNKQNNGFIMKTAIIEIQNQYPAVLSQIIEEVQGKDYYLFKPGITEAVICDFIKDATHQQLFIGALKTSKKPSRICSLYYREEGASLRGKEILQELASLTGGVVFDAPTPEAIPCIMQDLFHQLEYGEKSGIRTGLINRLKEHTLEGNNDWFRVLSVNSFYKENQKTRIENQNEHSIFNSLQENCKTRNEALNSFNRTFTDPASSLKQQLITNFYNQNLTFGTNNIQTNPFVYIVFRGNDTLGTSLVHTLYDTIDTLRNDSMALLGTKDDDCHVFLVILIDNLIQYTADDKKKLAALLNELNSFDPEYAKVPGIYLLSERNDHFSSNPDGYKNLSRVEFEEMVIENLVSLNVNQNLVLQAYVKNFDARKSPLIYDRFLSIGNVTVFAEQQQFADRVSNKLCYNLLTKLYTDEFKTDPDSVTREVDNYFADLLFVSLKTQVLLGNEGLNLLSRIDCPSALETDFTTSWKELKLRYVDQASPGLVYIPKTLYNRSFIEYIQFLFFDVRNYVESCNAPGTFNSIVQEKIAELLQFKINQLEAYTDRLIYNGHLSSPKQAEQWIEKLYDKLKSYIEVDYLNDIEKDTTYREYSNFAYKTLGLEITDDNPATPLDLLKEKLESFPLPVATRFKYYSLAGLFTAGSLAFFYTGLLPFEGLLSLIIPLLVIVWGEYRINQSMKQLRKMINWFGIAHRHKSRKQALDFLIAQLNQMLTDLKDKVNREDDTITPDKLYTENLTEQDYLDLFRKALTESLPGYFELESKSTNAISNFHIDLTKGIYDNNRNQINIMDTESIEKIAGLDKISWNGFYNDLINTKDTLSEFKFPTIELNFLPPDFDGLLTRASSKPGINLLMKLKYEEVIKERLYYLALLDVLNDQELAELKGFYNHKIWIQKIDSLVNIFNSISPVPNVNFFSLWRKVCYYQVWLNEVARIIKNDESSKEIIKSGNIFELWKKMYLARKEFREKLSENSNKILSFNVGNALHLWNIIQQSPIRDKLLKHIKCWSFSPVYLTNTFHKYSSYEGLNYLSDQKYLPGNLKLMMQKDLSSLLEDNRIWKDAESKKKNNLTFNHFVVIPFEDQSLLKNLSDILISPDFVDQDKGGWRAYFLDDFCDKYLKTKKQRKEFKWLFQAD